MTDGEPKPNYLLHVGLFLLTFLTTTAAGSLYIHPQTEAEGPLGWIARVPPISDGLAYSVPLLLILVCHEFGHYFAAKAHGVPASLPFFIPLPPSFGLGTMGAVIGMRQITADRRKLIDIAAAGPLAGLAVAIPVVLYGLALSEVHPMRGGGIQEGNSLLYAALKYVAKGVWLPDGKQDVFLHPTAWAGWAGLFVTMINLLPIGQLDGGHIAVARYGNGYNRVARLLHRSLPLVAAAVFAWSYQALLAEAGGRPEAKLVPELALSAATFWLMWFVLLAVLARIARTADHPPVEERPLPRSRRLLFGLVALVLVLVFMPVPLRVTLADGAGQGPPTGEPTPK